MRTFVEVSLSCRIIAFKNTITCRHKWTFILTNATAAMISGVKRSFHITQRTQRTQRNGRSATDVGLADVTTASVATYWPFLRTCTSLSYVACAALVEALLYRQCVKVRDGRVCHCHLNVSHSVRCSSMWTIYSRRFFTRTTHCRRQSSTCSTSWTTPRSNMASTTLKSRTCGKATGSDSWLTFNDSSLLFLIAFYSTPRTICFFLFFMSCITITLLSFYFFTPFPFKTFSIRFCYVLD